MGEKQKKPKGFKLEFEDGLEFHCVPDTTHAFIHAEEPEGDHLFIYKSVDPNEEPIGHFVFREQLENFDSIVMFMDANGFNVIEDERLSDNDRIAFNAFKARQRVQKMLTHEGFWISPRNDRIISNTVEYIVYLAERGQL